MAMPKDFKHLSETIERIRFVKLGKKRSEATKACIRWLQYCYRPY